MFYFTHVLASFQEFGAAEVAVQMFAHYTPTAFTSFAALPIVFNHCKQLRVLLVYEHCRFFACYQTVHKIVSLHVCVLPRNIDFDLF